MPEPGPSAVLPTDTFDKLFSRLVGHPNGAHTQPAVAQAVDFYGNTTSFMVQTVRNEDGPFVFVTLVDADGSKRFVLPPLVVKLIDRQRDSITTTIRRRHGKRLAAERPMPSGGFTPEARAKALATRKAKAARRHARKAAR